MMKNIIFTITILAVLTHSGTSYAKAKEVNVENTLQPITSLINDWNQFRAGIIARTSQFNKDSDISAAQLPTLSQTLIGKWHLARQQVSGGYQVRAVLDLKKNHHFVYTYRLIAGDSTQDWNYSGRWQEKNKILVLLIKQSNYPGELPGDVLFWRLLHIGHSRLVYVRSSVQEMQAMRRETTMRGS